VAENNDTESTINLRNTRQPTDIIHHGNVFIAPGCKEHARRLVARCRQERPQKRVQVEQIKEFKDQSLSPYPSGGYANTFKLVDHDSDTTLI
jgi:hypothetical protein